MTTTICRWGNHISEKLGNLPKDTQRAEDPLQVNSGMCPSWKLWFCQWQSLQQCWGLHRTDKKTDTREIQLNKLNKQTNKPKPWQSVEKKAECLPLPILSLSLGFHAFSLSLPICSQVEGPFVITLVQLALHLEVKTLRDLVVTYSVFRN